MPSGKSRYALVLAAGKGTRFKSDKPKVLHEICGKPMIEYLLDRLPELGVRKTILVIGEGAEEVKQALAGYDLDYVAQHKQLGTGHAVMSALDILKDLSGSLIVLYGDTPLISTSALTELFEKLEKTEADEALLTVELEDPTGYGRIIRDDAGQVADIIEEKEATASQKLVKEVNAGFVCFEIESLVENLQYLSNENQAGEYYLTDMVKILRGRGRDVQTALIPAPGEEIFGINSRDQLAQAARKLRLRINQHLMEAGVTIIDPGTVYIDADVTIGPDTKIYPGVVIEGKTAIGRGCQIRSYCHLENTRIEDNVLIDHCSVVRDSSVASQSRIGPFAHLRANSQVSKNVRIGNFVELKSSTIGSSSSAAHLSYLGDSQIGRQVNIGAGTITCNYDGEKKHPTIIEDQVFVGSDSQFVAPVTIGKGAWIAAGSTITEDVPEDSLAVARSKQVNKENWAKEKRKK